VAQNSDHYAIVIGIDNYPHLRPLRSSAQDARTFAEWLVAPAGGCVPQRNVTLLVSSPETPVESSPARPQRWEIDRELLNYGGGSGGRLGKRLYFYFAGHCFGPAADLGLLMADASPQRLGANIGLQRYRSFLRSSGLFDEVIYVVDGLRDPNVTAPTMPPSLVGPEQRADASVAELLLLAAVSQAQGPGDEPRGRLTQAVLEGLQGKAADAGGRITSETLGAYVRLRVQELAAELAVATEPEIETSGRSIVLADAAADRGEATLIVEVPHWTARVRIYDDLLRPVEHVGTVKGARGAATYRSETQLAPGLYKVEVALGEQSEQQLVLLRREGKAVVRLSAWKGLKPLSGVPFDGATDRRIRSIAEWSRKRTWTWTAVPNRESCLFLYVCAVGARPTQGFADGLQLLTADGREVVDLCGETVEMRRSAGWMAFCADLPAGYYVLCRRRRGKRVRYQPLYLCPGLQTQLFVPAHRGPSLRALTLSMAPLEQGFRADRETAAAKRFVTASLRGGGGAAEVLADHVERLLEGEEADPWLGVLAAYALLQDRKNEAAGCASGKVSAGLVEKIMAFLGRTIAHHPDLEALRLHDDQPASGPILHPPLLRVGLQRVRRHATRFAGTIPRDSLTDCVLDVQAANSPWTAWRELKRMPRFDGEPALTAAKGAKLATWGRAAHWRSHRLKRQRESSEALEAQDPIAAGHAAPPSAPIYQLVQVPEAGESLPRGPAMDAATGLGGSPPVGSNSAAVAAAALRDTPLIELARDLLYGAGVESAPATLVVAPAPSVGNLLGSVTAKEVSAASGLPLDRTANALQLLRQSGSLQPPAAELPVESVAPGAAADPSFAAVAQEVARHLLKVADPGPASSGASVAGPEAPEPVVTIEECVAQLRAEAQRLVLAEGGQQESSEATELARRLSARLLEVAAALLAQAYFVAITGLSGQIERCNGGFRTLLEAAGPPGTTAYAHSRKNWERAFHDAPLGPSSLADPAPVPDAVLPRKGEARIWELRRSAVVDEPGQAVRAHLNFLRIQGAGRLTAEALMQVNLLLPQVAMFSSLLTLGSKERRTEYAAALDTLTRQLESLAGEASYPASSAPEGAGSSSLLA
jgi:hypothetical protein